MSKYLRTIKNKPTNWKQFLSSDKYTLGLIKKYSNLEFQGVFLRSFELESSGSGQVYSWYPAPGSLLAFPHPCLAPPALGGPHIHVSNEIYRSRLCPRPSTYPNQLLLGHPSWYTILVSPGDGDPGRRHRRVLEGA